MEIIGIKTKKTWAGPGMDAYDAEMTIWSEDSKGYKYLHYNCSEGDHYTVADYSIFDYMTGGEDCEEPSFDGFEEEYESLADAIQSNYIDGFIALDNVVKDMCDITYGHRENIYKYIVSDIEIINNIEERADDDKSPYVVSGGFDYKNNAMNASVKRNVEVIVDIEAPEIRYLFQMKDENGNIIESFDDEEAPRNSKWYLLYLKMKNEIDEYL